MRVAWALMLVALGAGVARADTVFDLRLGQLGPEAPPDLSARLVTTDLGAVPFGTTTLEQYRVTGVTGQLNGVAIAGVGGADVDELLTVDLGAPAYAELGVGDGISFSLVDGHVISIVMGDTQPEIYSTPQDLSFSYGLPVDPLITREVAATPEPGTMGLVGTGVLGVVGMVRRRVRG